MITKLSDAEKHLDALRNSVSQFDNLRMQVEQTHKQNARLLESFFDAVEKDRSSWNYKIIGKEGTVTEGPLNKQGHAILRTIIGSPATMSFGGEAVCPERVGCSFIGQFAGKCLYICKQVKVKGRNPTSTNGLTSSSARCHLNTITYSKTGRSG